MYTEKTKFRSCCTSELGTRIFAVFNMLVTSLGFVAGIIFIMYMLCFYDGPAHPLSIVLALLIDLILLVYFVIAIVFSGFLLAGVVQKRPDYMHAYFVYGIVNVFLSTGASILGFFLVSPYLAGSCIVTIIFYTLCLVMIRCTYVNYQKQQTQFASKPLTNEETI